MQQVIYSNVKELVEQQQYLFEGFWNRAIPVETRINEIEGIIPGETKVIQIPLKIQELFIHLVKSAKEEILLILPTTNAFYREERLGIIRLLKEATIERNIDVRALTPINEVIEQKVWRMMALAVDQGKNLDIRPVHHMTSAEVTVTTVTILVIDKKESLVIEKIDDSKEDFLDATGFATYSNSKPTVLSYLSIFESLWQQTELYEHVKESNEKLEKANEHLLATERAKEEFISMVSHELKTPIAPMKLYTEMLLKSIPSFGNITEKQKNALQVIHKDILKLEVLISDILDVYKLDIGRFRLKKTGVDIEGLVKQSIADFMPLTKVKRIKLLADVRTSGTIICDSGRISQVLSNLVKNSIDFVPQDNGSIIIRVEQERTEEKQEKDVSLNDSITNPSAGIVNNHKVVFTIEDNGIGIKAENAANLFKKFYQIDTSATRKHGGTGLGLAISRGIVEAHGGRIWLDKTYTTGTSIKFTLPRDVEINGQKTSDDLTQ